MRERTVASDGPLEQRRVCMARWETSRARVADAISAMRSSVAEPRTDGRYRISL